MTAPFSLRQMPVAQQFQHLLDRVEGVANALGDNASDNPGIEDIDPLIAANWYRQVQRIAATINRNHL